MRVLASVGQGVLIAWQAIEFDFLPGLGCCSAFGRGQTYRQLSCQSNLADQGSLVPRQQME